MDELSQERLKAELALKPEPLTTMREDETWLHVGAVSISKQFSRFSVGFSHPMVPETRFGLQPFDVGGKRGWALVLHSGGNPPHYFAGWLPAEDEARAKVWLDRLNLEVQQRIAPQLKERALGMRPPDGTQESSVEILACQFGNEWAPDDHWGEETVRLTRDGVIDYRRRGRGEEQQHVHGRVAQARFEELVATLETTSFPSPPQKFFPPGASVCTLSTESPLRRMPIEYHAALRLHGYGEIIGSLHSLCSAFRESKAAILAEWQFAANA